MEKYDCLIVGAGPSGSTAAKHIAKKGYKVLVVDSRGKPGTPQQCSGLFSRNILDIISLKKNEILCEIKGARIYSPSMKLFEIKTKKTQGYVVDRTIFDARLLDEAKSAGAKIRTKTRFLKYDKNIAYFSGGYNVSAKIIIGADGPNSVVAKNFGFPELEKKISGIIKLYPEKPKEDVVELYLSRKTAPGFFAWKIPRKNDVEFGIGTDKNTKQYFDRFLLAHNVKKKPKATTGGIIPLKWRKETVRRNCLLVGDAAGHTKATTGGGVVLGIRAAKIAADAVCDALQKDDIAILSTYETKWKKEIGRDLKYALLIRNFLNSLNDSEIDKLVSISSQKVVVDFLKEKGDMDYPTKMIFAAIKRPKIWLPYMRLIPAILKNIFYCIQHMDHNKKA
ncbi:MAG: NAD(P)/FAD-dependent oxidoreductase [Candidatus Aenigmarchaeota archaeon]|nr:NAD(P)/FAD-dependent oxidoreductase [Candidatus Aenigmarchaeota archaeon]